MQTIRKLIFLIIALSLSCNLIGETKLTKVQFTTENNKKVVFELNNSSTSESLIQLLPITLEFEDYSNTEKVTYPPNSLSTVNTPSGYNPSIGDICLYAPWGNICIFYKDFGYASGLVSMGKVVEGAENIKILEGKIKIELVN